MWNVFHFGYTWISAVGHYTSTISYHLRKNLHQCPTAEMFVVGEITSQSSTMVCLITTWKKEEEKKNWVRFILQNLLQWMTCSRLYIEHITWGLTQPSIRVSAQSKFHLHNTNFTCKFHMWRKFVACKICAGNAKFAFDANFVLLHRNPTRATWVPFIARISFLWHDEGMQNLHCADTCVKCKFHMQNLHVKFASCRWNYCLVQTPY